jgi:hypothetical protein
LKNSKIYSPETCIFVPQEINNLFVKSNSIRGKCPIGVTYDEKYNKYRCGYQRGKRNNSIYLGSFDTKKEAFNAYKITKENYIKEIADKYKNKIPNKLYKAMYDWNVEIDD